MSVGHVVRALAAALACALVLGGCGTDGVALAPPTTSSPRSAPPSTTTSSVPPSTTTPATTTEAPPTTSGPPTTPAVAPTEPPEPVTLAIDGNPMLEFSVAVGDGVDLTRDELARFVAATLTDPRGWVGRGVGFRIVDEGGAFTILVAEPDRVDELCAPLRTNGYFSCARNGWVAMNSLRWFGATDDWPADLDTYRRYLVNHEIGHYILGPAHPSCPGPGRPAPIMMQQTKGLDGCVANGWVEPDLDAAE